MVRARGRNRRPSCACRVKGELLIHLSSKIYYRKKAIPVHCTATLGAGLCRPNRIGDRTAPRSDVDAADDLEALSRLLAPGGTLLLVFEPPSASKIPGIAEACSEQLREHGFARVTTSRHEAMVAVRAIRRR